MTSESSIDIKAPAIVETLERRDAGAGAAVRGCGRRKTGGMSSSIITVEDSFHMVQDEEGADESRWGEGM